MLSKLHGHAECSHLVTVKAAATTSLSSEDGVWQALDPNLLSAIGPSSEGELGSPVRQERGQTSSREDGGDHLYVCQGDSCSLNPSYPVSLTDVESQSR